MKPLIGTAAGAAILLFLLEGLLRADYEFKAQSYSPGTWHTPLLHDFDNDGLLDVVTSNYADGTVCFRPGRGDGTFRAEVVSATGWSVELSRGSAVDIDGDGDLDLVGARPLTSPGRLRNVVVILNEGDGSFRPGVDIALPYEQWIGGFAIGDMDRDGTPDLVLTAYSYTGKWIEQGGGWPPIPVCNRYLNVLLGNGDGSFRFFDRTLLVKNAEGDGAPPILLGDLDEDSRLDALTFDLEGHTQVRLGTGDGWFKRKPVTSPSVTDGIVTELVDFNADGHLDLLSHSGVHLGKGDGTFRNVATLVQYSKAVGDVDRDGILDVVAVGNGVVHVFFGAGDGTFPRSWIHDFGDALNSMKMHERAALGDLDGDGWLDLLAGGTYLPEQDEVGIIVLFNDGGWYRLSGHSETESRRADHTRPGTRAARPGQ